MYLKVDDCPGESTDGEHAEWIEILDFNHEIVQPASTTASTAGGGTTARCVHKDFTIKKFVDKASPKLYQFCCSGKHIKNVKLEFFRAGGDKRVKYLEIAMEDVVVSRASPKAGTDFPYEEIDFNYASIKWTYSQQKREDGTQAGQTTGGWSLLKNAAAA
jgi:type VI secretion system secreted protein Hcp